MNLLAPVSEIMTSKVITVSPEDTLESIHKIFSEKSIHHLPVVEGGKLVGMLSKSDFLFFSHASDDDVYEEFLESMRRRNYRVKDIMTTKLAKLDQGDRINVALEVFKVNRFHALPVMDGDELVGILTTFDIINYLATDQGAEMKYN